MNYVIFLKIYIYILRKDPHEARARDEPGRKSPKKIHYFGTSPEEIVSISALRNHSLG